MIDIIIGLIFGVLIWALINSSNNHDVCFSEMEKRGIAAMGCCSVVVGGTRNTDYLSEHCVDCPYLVLNMEGKEARK